MLRLATVVGCNYAGTGSDLRGCINDAVAMRTALVNQFGFQERNITLLIDDNTTELPTGANIMRALYDMVQRARGAQRNGAHLFFHFSGHGTLLSGGPYDHHDAIVPCDNNLITDVDFRRLLDQVPPSATFTMVSDSCHSGGLIGQEKEQIGPASNRRASRGAALNRAPGGRFLPCETILRRLGVANLHQLESHMVGRFRGDASALFRHSRAPVPVPRPDSGILLSGCQWDESAEEQVYYGTVHHGAFTLALLLSTRGGRGDLTPWNNWVVVTAATAKLQRSGFTQHPCLYCDDNNVGKLFLGTRI